MNNEYVVYPRLKKPAAEDLAGKYAAQPIKELASKYTGTGNSGIDYAPTGTRIRTDQLVELQQAVRSVASGCGYPETGSGTVNYSEFDSQCAVLLHQMMRLEPTEAARIEVWAFLSCVLLPDIVRWRFFGDVTAEERFIGSNRGLRRNTLGRLWWRAYLLHDSTRAKPYDLIDKLGEDDLVQLTERSTIAMDPILLTAVADAFMKSVDLYPNLPRRDLMREAVKRIRRLISLLSFEALDRSDVARIMNSVFEQTATALIANT